MDINEIDDFVEAEGETMDDAVVSAETIPVKTEVEEPEQVTNKQVTVETETEDSETKETAEDYTKSLLERGGKVPVDQHIKLRQRAQAAEARAKQLEEQLSTRPDAENSENDDELDKLPDDEYLTVGQVKAFVAKEAAKQAKLNEARTFDQGVIESAKTTAEKYPDYADIMQVEREMELLKPADIAKIKASKNPAETAYQLTKQKLAVIQNAINPKPKGKSSVDEPKSKITQEAILEDEDIFEEAFAT